MPPRDPRTGWRPKPYHFRKPGQTVGLLRVRIGGVTHYCGTWGTAEAIAEYDRLIAEWSAAGHAPISAPPQATVSELFAAMLTWSAEYHGRTNPHYYHYRHVGREAVALYAHLPAGEFGPAAFRAVRERFVAEGHARSHVNQLSNKLRRAFKWGVEHGFCSASTWQALCAVQPLRAGRTAAHEAEPGRLPTVADVEATIAQLPPAVAALVRVQWLAGMRPGETCRLKGTGIDKSQAIWLYQTRDHKTAHHGKARRVWLGPLAQAVLTPLLEEHGDGYLFPSLGRHISLWSYCRAVRLACDRAGVPRWTPKQLRGLRATQVEEAYNLEHAKSVLGHSKSTVTALHYARADDAMARRVAAETG